METVLLVGGGASEGEAGNGCRPVGQDGSSLRSALERVGYSVVQARDEAGLMARLHGPLPDLIVLACSSRELDPATFCATVRRDTATQRIPIVVLSDGSMRVGSAGAPGGADLVFPAGMSPLEVADRLRRYFF
ncbi:MAG TPA: hypothetical protein VFC42_01770 [Methylomirabilota bacterium]|nr:hypothetical protein [Methylomirabilota bacterium]